MKPVPPATGGVTDPGLVSETASELGVTPGPAAGDRSGAVDPVDENLTQARLGRAPRDRLEATIVLEAWDGRPARRALSDARSLVGHEPPLANGKGRIDLGDDSERVSVIGEAVALVLSILSVAAWARPLSRELGAHTLAHAIQIALPVAVGLQWAVRSRYLSRRKGLALLAREGIALSCAVAVGVELPVAVGPRGGTVAALLIAVWVGGTVLTRRGWGLLYAFSLVLTTIALDLGFSPYVVLGALAALTVGLCCAAVLTRRVSTDDRPGSVPRAVLAAVLGAGIGILLVGDPSLGWGVRGVHPAIALVPSVIGSFWGGYHLWNLYGEIPLGLSGVPLERASRVGFTDPAMRVFLGAVLRLLGATVVLSGIVIALGRWTQGTDALSVFVAFGCAALVSMMVSLLESLAFQRAALVAVGVALLSEFAWRHLVHVHTAGSALAVGAMVGILVTVPPLIAVLSRSGRVLATTLLIR